MQQMRCTADDECSIHFWDVADQLRDLCVIISDGSGFIALLCPRSLSNADQNMHWATVQGLRM